MSYPVSLIAEPRVVKLVSTGRLSDPVLLLLLDPANTDRPRAELEQLLRDLAEIEGGTSGRLLAQSSLAAIFPGGRPLSNFVNAAFAYWRPREPNRFNDAAFGAWYAAFDKDTSLAEVVYHIWRELDRVQDWNARIEWAEMWASVSGQFVDLRGVEEQIPCLDSDSDIGYPQGNALGREARDAGYNGIVYPSVRRPAGICVVALWPQVVQSVMQGAIVTAAWSGNQCPVITIDSGDRMSERAGA